MSHSIATLVGSAVLCTPLAFAATPAHAEFASAGSAPVTGAALAAAQPALQGAPLSDAALASMRAGGNGSMNLIVAPPPAPTAAVVQVSAVRLWDEVVPPSPAPKPQQTSVSVNSHSAVVNLRNPQQNNASVSAGPVHR